MRRIAALFATLVALAFVPSPAQAGTARLATPPVNPVPGVRGGHGLTITNTEVIDARQLDYTVTTSALAKPVHIRVVLPTNFDPHRRYPVLYLYHGTSGRPSDWVGAGHALQSTAGKDLILVLPESGYDGDGGGWFVNWFNFGRGGTPMWETFEIDQVIPWIDANFPTIADRDHRAVAGLSQGGFGAMHAAARHPDMFTSVASFSGAPEIYRNPLIRAGADFIIEGTTWVVTPGNIPFSAFGDPITNGVHWAGHDPGTMVDNLRGMDIELWTASGIPGEYDSAGNQYGGGAGNVIELATHLSTLSFAGHLDQAGIEYRMDDYVLGTHQFAYWARDLAQYLPNLMERFAHPSTPARKTYMSIEPSWSQWGWSVRTNRAAGEERFTILRDAGTDGFTFSGRGTAEVTTPAAYRPGARYTVVIAGAPSSGTTTLTADSGGRLRIHLDLGRQASDLATLGLPGGLGSQRDTVARVAIAPASSAEPTPAPADPSSANQLKKALDDVLSPVLRLVSGLLG